MKHLIILVLCAMPLHAMLELSIGHVGSRDTVYGELMANTSGFQDEQFFCEELGTYVQSALDYAKIGLSELQAGLTEEEFDGLTVVELYKLDIASQKLKEAMEQHQERLKSAGQWKDPESAVADESDTGISKLLCCKGYIHHKCLVLMPEGSSCLLCNNSEPSDRLSKKRGFKTNCPVCQEELPRKPKPLERLRKRIKG